MKRNIRKVLASLLLSLFFAAALLHEASLGESASGAGPASGAEYAFLNDWLSYLIYQNDQNCDMLWILNHVQAACEHEDWDSLLKANAALECGALYVEKRERAGLATTREQYGELASRYSVNIYAAEYIEESGLSKQEMQSHISTLRSDLRGGFFLKSVRKTLRETVGILKEIYQIRMDYDACCTAYLIRLLGVSESTLHLRARIQKELPLVFSAMPPDGLSFGELDVLMISLQDQLKAAYEKYGLLNSIVKNDIFLLHEALNTSGHALLEEDYFPVRGASAVLPAPKWYFSQSAGFIWAFDDSDGYRLPKELEELAENPTFLRIHCTDAIGAELTAYANQLAAFGCEGELYRNGETVVFTCQGDGWSMDIVWDGEIMKQFLYGRIPCLAPEGYAVYMKDR